MPRIKVEGRTRHILRSIGSLAGIAISVTAQRLIGRPLVPQWTRHFEIGNLFWRGQFNYAFTLADISEARAYFDSLQTLIDEPFEVDICAAKPSAPKGDWFRPQTPRLSATMLYFHGGGYMFYAAVTRHMIKTLAGAVGIEIFAPDYRLTPEHSHPAQTQDALAAYRFLLAQGVDPARLVVAGDSAGGHLTLMTLVALRDAGLPQPALAIGLSPWTDIGERGASMIDNNKFDLVQGYMALKFGEWLKGSTGFTREQLSPIHQDFRGLAPIYLQGGGKEMLIDMIRDFAATVRDQGCDIMLDVWEHMTHEFQANGHTLAESREALERLAEAIDCHVGPQRRAFLQSRATEIASPR